METLSRTLSEHIATVEGLGCRQYLPEYHKTIPSVNARQQGQQHVTKRCDLPLLLYRRHLCFVSYYGLGRTRVRIHVQR